MIGNLFKTLWPAKAVKPRPAMKRIRLDGQGPIYAIGDVHGHIELLSGLEDLIIADGAALEGEKRIILLGDLIDRGPKSAQVLDHVLKSLPQGWQRLVIAGNHEATFLDALDDHKVLERWLGFGGLETLGSYGIGYEQLRDSLGSQSRLSALLFAHIPTDHLEFLENLAVAITIDELVFCHAGPRHDKGLDAHSDHDLLWYAGPRPPLAGAETVFIHGHVPVEQVEVSPNRINVDTGAYRSGVLSAIRLVRGQPPKILSYAA